MAEKTKLFSSSSSSTNDDDNGDDEDEIEYNEFDVDDISDMVVDHGLSPIIVGYEMIINTCGYGWFQRILLLVCGWAFVSDSIEIQVVSFVLPAACDLEMTSSDKGWLNGIIFVGMMIGGYTFGGTADIKGRRFVLLCSLTINGLFGFLSAFAPTFTWFLLFRFFSGIGVGAALPVLFSYFAEFLSRDIRGPMVEGLASFLLLGNIMAAGGAWFIIPVQRFTMFGHMVSSWRLFVAVFSLPALSAAMLFLFMPESPKFLIHNGRIEDARNVFIKMFELNHRKTIVPKIITDMQFYDQIDKTTLHEDSFSKVLKSTRSLFISDRLRATIPLLAIWFTMSFAYYGLWMWLPEIYKRIEIQGSFCSSSNINNVARSTNHSYGSLSTNTTMTYNTSALNRTLFFYPCNNEDVESSNIYLKTFLIAISNIPGAVVTIATIDKAGRRNLLASSMLLSGIIVLFFLLVTKEIEMTVMSCIFSGLTVIAWNVLNAIALENYPTHLRSTAFGLQTSIGRIASIIGNVVFGLLIDVQCTVPLVLVTVCFIVGGISVLIVPNTDRVMLS